MQLSKLWRKFLPSGNTKEEQKFSQTKKNQKKFKLWKNQEKVGIIIDNYNIWKSIETAKKEGLIKGKLDYKKLLDYFGSPGQIVYSKIYITVSDEQEKLNGFIGFLESLGMDVVKKVAKYIKTDEGTVFSKSNLDVEIAVDITEYLQNNHLDRIVLFSGDSDFIYLLKTLHSKGIKIDVISSDNSLAYDLKEEADRVFYLENPEVWENIKR